MTGPNGYSRIKGARLAPGTEPHLPLGQHVKVLLACANMMPAETAESAVSAWNWWVERERAENPEFKIDLRNLDLRRPEWQKTTLHVQRQSDNSQSFDLTRIDLSHALMWGAHLPNASLRGARLDGADMGSTNFDGANLFEAHLERAYLGRA